MDGTFVNYGIMFVGYPTETDEDTANEDPGIFGKIKEKLSYCFLSDPSDHDSGKNVLIRAYGSGSAIGAGLGALAGVVALFACNAHLPTLNAWQSLLTSRLRIEKGPQP